MDPYSARVGRNGLVYVSDFTSFYLAMVFDQRGNFIGELGSSSGLKATSAYITFQPGPYVEHCDVTNVPEIATVGNSYAIQITLRDDGWSLIENSELVYNLQVVISGSMIQSTQLYPFEYKIDANNIQWKGNGVYEVLMTFDRSSLAYPDPDNPDTKIGRAHV